DGVAPVRVEAVVLLRIPRAVAVAAQIEGNRVPSRRGQGLGGSAPRIPRLAAAVLQQNDPVARLAPRIGDEREPVGGGELETNGFAGGALRLGRLYLWRRRKPRRRAGIDPPFNRPVRPSRSSPRLVVIRRRRRTWRCATKRCRRTAGSTAT